MQRKDYQLIGVSIFFAAVFAIIVSTVLFGGAQKRIAVPQVEKISSDFPDVQNDPNYKAIFNSNALDPTQIIEINPGNNNNPFSGTQ